MKDPFCPPFFCTPITNYVLYIARYYATSTCAFGGMETFPFVPTSLVGAYYLRTQTNVPFFYITIYWIFSICPPPGPYAPPVAEHMPLHSKPLRKNMASASVGADNMQNKAGEHKPKIIHLLWHLLCNTKMHIVPGA